jgi:membrane-bound serine protease (ClpP class)
MNLQGTIRGMKIFTLALCSLYILLNIPARPQGGVSAIALSNETKTKKVFVFTLHQEIAPAAVRLVSRAFQQARENKADYIIMRLNTFGGALDAADSIRTAILTSKIPVLVLIEQNAASAGALISISCDSIYMRSGSTIGSASVVNQTGEVMPDKYQSYMRAMMRATAQQKGRDPKIAEGMVTPNNYLKEMADSGKIIALTTDEAIKYKYCNGVANNIDEVLTKAKLNNYEVIYYQPTWVDAIINFLLNPFVNSILLLLIMGGIYLEIQHPGIGLPLFVCIGAALLYFAPLYLEGLAANWEILVFVLGIALVILEIYVFPGHGIWLATGITFIIAGLTLSLVNNHNFDFTFTPMQDVVYALFRVVGIITIAIICGIAFGGSIFNTSVMKKVVLTTTQEKNVAYSSDMHQMKKMTGKSGIADTDLRPAGIVVVDNEKYDAITDGAYIERLDNVVVKEIRGNYLVVRKA